MFCSSGASSRFYESVWRENFQDSERGVSDQATDEAEDENKKGGLKPCLTPKQKKLPKALQAGIRKKNRPCRG